jgi:drug/metabolite transporter (DMT)-like permease
MLQSATNTTKDPSQLLVVAGFGAIYVLWGSTYVAIVIALETIPPFTMAGIRFIIAGVLLYFWCRLRGQPTPGLTSLGHISLSGTLMLFGGTGAVVWVEQYIPSSLTAIIVATVPLWFVLLDRYQWKYHLSSKRIIVGLLVGFAGVILLFGDKSTFTLGADKMKVISFFVLIAGTIFWAIGSLYSKYKPVQGSPAIKAAIQMMVAGFVSIFAAWITGEQHRMSMDAISVNSILAVSYLIVAGSLLGYMSYIWLLSIRPPSLVGTYAYVNPVVAIFLGWLIAGEHITAQQVIALMIILVGVVLVNFGKKG